MIRSSDGVDIAYDVHGAGALTVVLVHGWAGNRTYWDQQVNFLAECYRVIALDLGGHGKSGLGRADWNLTAFGDDVVAVVEEVGAGKVALVGHSMGGDAVVYAARQLGDRVAGLVWIDVFRSLGHEREAPPETVESFVAPFREDFTAAVHAFVRRLLPTADESLIRRVAADMEASPREPALNSLRYALNREPALLAALSHIAAPIVAINPETGPTDVDALGRHGVETILLEGVGHYPMLEDPDRFNEVLASTLASFDS